jgi:hypothetical protein
VNELDPSIAWAAGFFEGEGTITQSNGRLVVRLNNTDPEPVKRFATIVAFGAIYGPYQYASRDGHRRKPFWIWHSEEYEALEVLELLWPLAEREATRAGTGARADRGNPAGPSGIAIATVTRCGSASSLP